MRLAANSKQLYAPKIIGRLFIRDKGINSQPHFTETETLYFSIFPSVQFLIHQHVGLLVQKHEQSPWLLRQHTPVS